MPVPRDTHRTAYETGRDGLQAVEWRQSLSVPRRLSRFPCVYISGRHPEGGAHHTHIAIPPCHTSARRDAVALVRG